VLALVAAGCHSGGGRTAAAVVPGGPPNTIRVALADVRWPLDPALAATRDETTLARTLYSTPLRLDAAGRVRPGLCSGWSADLERRAWVFFCRSARAIAQELRRVARLKASPAHWIFRGAEITARAQTLRVRLPFGWRRFP
jgi:MarR-like DNA-binding transcriptional regulator SgrR of sgrS sRNA